MKIVRLLLWIAVVVVAGLLGREVLKQKEVVASEPFGVPFTLVAQDGKPITEKAFTGKPTALFFGFTHCPEVCPTTLFELNGWLTKVDPDGSRLQAYFVTVDPERDTPELIGQYVGNVSERITGISGPADKVLEICGPAAGKRLVDPRELYGNSFAEAADKFPDSGRMQGLGWQPEYTLDDTIRDTFLHMRNLPHEELLALAGLKVEEVQVPVPA